MALATVFFAPVVNADQYDSQIAALNSQIAQQQSAASSLQGQADTLSNKVSALADQEAAIRAQLELNQAKQAQTTQRIADAQQQLVTKKSILDENIRDIYQESQVTPIEMLASSKNFSDYVDRQQYLDQIKDHIQDEYGQISKLKDSLVSQQADLNRLTTQQSSMVAVLAQEKAQQNQLLAQTQGQESAYQQLVAGNQNKLNSIVAARAAAIRSSNSGLSLVASGGGCGPYPDKWCHAAQDSMTTDGNYYNRECVSYVAYRRETTGHALPSNWGNASQWYANVDHYSNPQPGDIAVWGANGNAWVGGYGHVAYVESVDGGGITISQYNFNVGNGDGMYSEMHVATGSTMWGGIGFIH